MRYLFTMACLLLATGVVADEGDFDFSSLGAKKALRDYKKALVEDKKAIELKRKKFDEEAESLAKTTRDAFVENLKKALKKSMQSGNLDEANKINAAIKALEQGTGPAGGSTTGTKGKKKAKKSKARIPKNAIKWNGHHYLAVNSKVTWNQAKAACEAAGGYLVRVQSREESNFIVRLAQRHLPLVVFNPSHKIYCWIGGSDAEQEGLWRFSDGSPMEYMNWKHGHEGEGGGDMIELFDTGKWNAMPSDDRHISFICEWDD